MLGSIAGCLLLYYLGRKGGEALVRRRFSNAAVDRTLASFRRHGVMAVLIPSILPPPAPFKVFVLLAGLAGIAPGKFTLAIAIGRGARYLVEGLLAIRYGDRAIAFMQDHAATASIVVAVLLAAALLGSIAWTKAAGRKRR